MTPLFAFQSQAALVFFGALAASTMFFIGIQIRVLFVKSMTPYAMGLGGEPFSPRGSVRTPSNVLNSSNSLKVRGVNAFTVSAQMIKFQSVWNWASPILVGHSMRPVGLGLNAELTIAKVVQGAGPFPAAVWSDLDLGDEVRYLLGSHRDILPDVLAELV